MVQAISAERTLILPEYNGQTPGLSWPLVWPAKDPNDAEMDFSLNVNGWLTEIGDTIASFTASWSPDGTGDLVVNSAFSHSGICTILTSGGVAFSTYVVTLTIHSATLGEVLSRNIELPVMPRYGDSIASGGGSVSGVIQ